MVAYRPASSTAETARSRKRCTGHFLHFGFGATPAAVATSLGKTMGAPPAGMFCCTTNEFCACCPWSAGNSSVPPGRSDGILSAASLARTASRSSVPACSTAVKSERADGALLAAAGTVADDRMAEPGAHVLPVHGDVVGEVGVHEEEVDARRLDRAEEAAEVLAVELEGLVHRDGVGAAALGREVGDALPEVLPVRGVLPEQRDPRRARQLPRLLLLVDPPHERGAEELDRRDDAEEILIAAAVDVGGAAAAVHVRDLVLLGDRALGLHDLDAAALVHLLDREIVPLLEEAADARLGARQRQRRADEELRGRAAASPAAGGEGDESERGAGGSRRAEDTGHGEPLVHCMKSMRARRARLLGRRPPGAGFPRGAPLSGRRPPSLHVPELIRWAPCTRSSRDSTPSRLASPFASGTRRSRSASWRGRRASMRRGSWRMGCGPVIGWRSGPRPRWRRSP